jgi:hypothetical protein
MLVYHQNPIPRLRRLPTWVFIAAICVAGGGLVLFLLITNPTVPASPTGLLTSSSPKSSVEVSPTPTSTGSPSLQPSYVAPPPSAGGQTFVRVNQLSVNPVSVSDKSAPVVLSVFVTVVPGADLGSGGVTFRLLLSDGSSSSGAPRSAPSDQQSYWVDFSISSAASSGTLTVSAASGEKVLFSQALVWPVLP